MTRPLIAALACGLLLSSAPLVGAESPSDVQAKLAELKREPTVRDVQEAALQYFRVNQAQVDGMRSRARLKALAPVLEVSGGYTQSQLDDVSTNSYLDLPTFEDPWVSRISGGMGWNLRGKATLNLPRLIFNPEELDVASLAGLVEGILKESTRLYYMRKRLQVDMVLKPPTDQATLISKQLRIEELTAMLDAMTGGWYQRALDSLKYGARYLPASGTQGRLPAENAKITLPKRASERTLSLTPAALAP